MNQPVRLGSQLDTGKQEIRDDNLATLSGPESPGNPGQEDRRAPSPPSQAAAGAKECSGELNFT